MTNEEKECAEEIKAVLIKYGLDMDGTYDGGIRIYPASKYRKDMEFRLDAIDFESEGD
jgi:hypothetical protein